MDLSRAKTVLILAFFALNIFLGHRLYFSPQPLKADGILTSEEAESASEMLRTAGYELLTDIPRQIPRLSLLHVSRLTLQEQIWADKLLGTNSIRGNTSDGSLVFIKGSESVLFSADGYLNFKFIPRAGGQGSEEIKANAERLLQDYGLWQDDLRFDLFLPHGSPGGGRVRFVQTYQGIPLFFSYTDVFFSSGQFTEVKMFRVVPLSFSNEEIQVITAADAIAGFLEDAPAFSEKRIVDISIGYYSRNYDAFRWEVAPVWRIAAWDGKIYSINAFTGKVENGNI